jgi:uncharacterized protein
MLSAITLPVQVEIANRGGARAMPLDELLRTKREDILRIAKNYGAYNVRVFGSVARGEADSESDIDLLVNMEPGRSLFDLGGLLMDLEELLGCNVDVVTEDGLRDRIRARVLREAVAL